MRILCATDLLPKSEAAFERAGMIAWRLRAHLFIVHVAKSQREERKAHAMLVRMVNRLRFRWGNCGIAPTVVLQRGNPAARLIEVIRQIAPELVVMGPRSRRVLYDRLYETLAERILAVRYCPVLIVQQRPINSYRDILLALDLSPAVGEIIRATECIVLEPGAHAFAVHAYEPDYGTLPYLPQPNESIGAANSAERAEAERELRRLFRKHSDRLVECNLVLSVAFPTAAIVTAIKALQPDVLVMGTSGYGRFRRLLLGSTASRVLDTVSCDVMVVPPGSVRQIPSGQNKLGQVNLTAIDELKKTKRREALGRAVCRPNLRARDLYSGA